MSFTTDKMLFAVHFCFLPDKQISNRKSLIRYVAILPFKETHSTSKAAEVAKISAASISFLYSEGRRRIASISKLGLPNDVYVKPKHLAKMALVSQSPASYAFENSFFGIFNY